MHIKNDTEQLTNMKIINNEYVTKLDQTSWKTTWQPKICDKFIFCLHFSKVFFQWLLS